METYPRLPPGSTTRPAPAGAVDRVLLDHAGLDTVFDDDPASADAAHPVTDHLQPVDGHGVKPAGEDDAVAGALLAFDR